MKISRSASNYEANIFCTYLSHRQCPDDSAALYSRIMDDSVEDADKAVLFARRHRWSVGLLDGGFALIKPDAELRRRIYVMFSILECSPAFSSLFLAQQRSPLYVLHMCFVGARAVLRALFGIVLIKVMRLA